MRLAIGISLVVGICGGMAVADIPVPSGQIISHADTVVDGATVRFRFLAPEISELGYGDVEGDFAFLCDAIALPKLNEMGLQPDLVMISMMSAQTDFGVANPDVIQFFEGFSIENTTCIWEQF